jgi:thiosulfate/3-mercaptopyruvate sulfurtransferase
MGAAAATASPLQFVAQARIAGETRVVDVRAETTCTAAALAGARCLPAAELFDADGAPVSFHVLRWLLGTVGLSGREHVLVLGDKAADAAAVGALLLLAGQHDVAVLDRPVALPADATGGNPRSMTREAVFTAPMRDRLLTLASDVGNADTIATGRPYDRLRSFARRYAEGAAALRLRLSP